MSLHKVFAPDQYTIRPRKRSAAFVPVVAPPVFTVTPHRRKKRIIQPEVLFDADWRRHNRVKIAPFVPVVTKTGFVRHYTGILIPLSQSTLAGETTYTNFDKFVANPVPSGVYTTDAKDTGFDDNLRVQAEIDAALGPSQSGTPTIDFQIDTWLTGGVDPNDFIDWTIGYVNMRYIRFRLIYSGIAEGNVSYITHLKPLIDTAPTVEQGGNFAVSIGGSVLTFPSPFHFPPFMPAPNVTSPTGAGFYATSTNLSATQATITIFNSSGVSVAGTVSWTASGE